jgi:ArsR family transcriptional regulator
MHEILNDDRVEGLPEKAVVEALGCLAHAVRLKIYRLLVRAGSSGLVAGEIGAAVDLPASNLSFHLKTLLHAGLVSVEQQGRYQRYVANIPLMLRVIAYLTENCCSDDPTQCEVFRAAVPEARPFLPPISARSKRKS